MGKSELIRPKVTEEGSLEWLQSTASVAKSWATAGERDARQLVKYLRDLRSHDWKLLVVGESNWGSFCRQVLGYDQAFLDEMEDGVNILDGVGYEGPVTTEQAQKVSRADKAKKEAGRQKGPAREKAGAPTGNRNASKNNGDNSENCNHCFERGNSSAYRIRKLRRDCPEAAERLERGEFKSVSAAERWANGQDPNPPRTTADGYTQLCRAWNKATKEEKERFITEKNQEGW